MKVYEPKDIRNLALLGHAGSGKTIIAESILYNSGAVNRRGSIEDNNTVSDFNELEHEKGSSVFMTPLSCEWQNIKFNILDTPGYDDYAGEVAAAAHVADSAIIVINAQNGMEMGAELGFSYAEMEKRPIMFFVNKLDVEQANFDETVNEIKDQFGGSVTLLQYPLETGPNFNTVIDLILNKAIKFTDGKAEKMDIPDSEKSKAEELRNEFIESVAETDEELMTKYFEEGELSEEDVKKGLRNAIINSQIYPVFCGSSKNNTGIESLMEFAKDVLPSPADMPAIKDENGNDINYNTGDKTALFVFKMQSDPKLGDMTFFKVYSGSVSASMDLINQRGSGERFGQIFSVMGKKRDEVDKMIAGDIGATVKLKNTHVGDTLHTKGFDIKIAPIPFPNPKVRTAIVPKTKGEEEKVGLALNALHEEDPTIIIEHSQELRQTIVYSQGELHLAAAKWRLKHRYKVEAEFIEPRVPYRETIQKGVESSYRHKKQSGGAGQFAEVHMHIEPYREGAPDPSQYNVKGRDLIDLDWGGKLEYINCIVGGVIDARFLPAILKGIMEKMNIGPLTGSYVRDIRVYIYDGKMHPVDSNEAAFKMAGSMAFKDAFTKADPKILEPIYNVKVKVPEEFVGDVMSDLPSRRGVIQGIETEGRYQIVNCKMPLAELDKYATALRSMTQARASYTSEYAEYVAVPGNVQQELMDKYKKEQEEEE
ncbi:MAG: elongation factor G [Candidatus Kapaibacterium sp.]